MIAAMVVFDDTREREVTLGAEQKQYQPIVALMGDGDERRMTMRIIPTDDERAAIAGGADIMLTMLTFRRPLQPFLLWTATKGDVREQKEIMELMGVR